RSAGCRSTVIDLHSHILAGIDDGPPSVEGSVAIAEAAVADGIRVLAATPHVREDYRSEEHTSELQSPCNLVCRLLLEKKKCRVSTLSQSPMLGFHKQMDNRLKLFEEILSFRMHCVEFDHSYMYVDGHQVASYVRYEFV